MTAGASSKIPNAGIEPVLTVAEAATALKLSQRTIRRMVADGSLEVVPGISSVRIRSRAVKALTNP